MCLSDHVVHSLVQRLCRRLTEWLLEALALLISATIRDWPDVGVHPVIRADLECHLGNLLQVILRASRDRAEEDLLGDSAAQGHRHSVHQLLCREQELLFREVLGNVSVRPGLTGMVSPGHNRELRLHEG